MYVLRVVHQLHLCNTYTHTTTIHTPPPPPPQQQQQVAAGVRTVEHITRDTADVTAQRAAVMQAAPELVALAEELQGCMGELRSRIGPLVQEVWI